MREQLGPRTGFLALLRGAGRAVVALGGNQTGGLDPVLLIPTDAGYDPHLTGTRALLCFPSLCSPDDDPVPYTLA